MFKVIPHRSLRSLGKAHETLVSAVGNGYLVSKVGAVEVAGACLRPSQEAVACLGYDTHRHLGTLGVAAVRSLWGIFHITAL